MQIEPARLETPRNNEGTTIVWNPIHVLGAPDPGRIPALEALGAKCEENETLRAALEREEMQKVPAPKNKDTKKTTDLPEGEYLCKHFATTTFRNVLRTILFLFPIGPDGELTTDKEIPTYGYFLECEIAALGGPEALEKRKTPLRCQFGKEKTTQSKKKSCPVVLA